MNMAIKKAIQLSVLTLVTFFAACILIHFCQMAYDRVPTYTDETTTEVETGTDPQSLEVENETTP